MISVDEAQRLVFERAKLSDAVSVELAQALGLPLAEAVGADVDSPPFDKALVDGYAVVAADLADGRATLEIVEEVMAGDVPQRAIARGQATRIMTGAPLPDGADACVMVERTEVEGSSAANLGRVRVVDASIESGRNLLRRATIMKQGQVVLSPNAVLEPAHIGLLAEVGRGQVKVRPRPTVAVISTGNELVPHQQVPGPGQIRNSNGPMLTAQITAAGGTPVDLGIVRDDPDALRRTIEQGLQSDILVLSGGVSAGVLDLVPGILSELGVQQVFHKVNLKPGKPIWFGVRETPDRTTLVFGLPGNPVSSFICFMLFVKPALGIIAGLCDGPPRMVEAVMRSNFRHRSDRVTYLPAVHSGEFPVSVEPLNWQGSADLRTMAAASSLLFLPQGERNYKAGEDVLILPLG